MSIIVDDEPAARRTVRECCEREPDLRVVGEYGDGRAALEAIRGAAAGSAVPRHPDGFADRHGAGARARSADTCRCIVFVTAYDHYALEAFEVSAVDYLLKPFDDDALPRDPGARAPPPGGGKFDRPSAH